MSLETALLAAGLAMSFITAIILGGNDAAEPTDCAVGAGAISIRNAVILFAIFTAAGAMTQGFMVMKTIGRGIVPEISIAGAFAAVAATSIWVFSISRLGYDISVTHAITGAVIGYGVVAFGLERINLYVLYMTILSWITSPIASMFLAAAFYKLLLGAIERFKIDVYSERFERTISYLLIGSLAFSAYAFGANDIANATGVYVTVAAKLGRMPDYNAMLMLAAFGSVGIAIGGFTIGPRVIRTVAFRITRLNILSGLAAELSNALVVYLFTTLPYYLIGFGLPISTSLATVGSIVGVGLTGSGRRGVNVGVVSRLMGLWVLTVPASATLSAAIYLLIRFVLAVA